MSFLSITFTPSEGNLRGINSDILDRNKLILLYRHPSISPRWGSFMLPILSILQRSREGGHRIRPRDHSFQKTYLQVRCIGFHGPIRVFLYLEGQPYVRKHLLHLKLIAIDSINKIILSFRLRKIDHFYCKLTIN